jgi:integrase/recombinase XerC
MTLALVKTGMTEPQIDALVEAWLQEKFTRSQSQKTVDEYRTYWNKFRQYFRDTVGEIPTTHPDLLHYISIALQDWSAKGNNGEVLAPASINARIAAISSLMEYAQRHSVIDLNPANIVQRKPVQAYRGATSLPPATIMEKLQQIDCATLQGKRDYALLAIALVTGRRLSEVANLQMSDIHSEGGPDSLRVRLVWRRAKGGKSAADVLPKVVAWKLLDYVEAVTEWLGYSPPYLWVALARNAYKGTQLGIKGLELVCDRHFGTTKFHTLRHSFAHAMEQAGADISEIQRRLMHSSLQTTGIYLQALRDDENKHADDLATMFGMG